MRVLYDITTLGNIHCAEGVHGAGIFRATESLGMALGRTAGVDLYLSSARAQYKKALRYIAETERFDPDRFLIPSLGSDDATGASMISPATVARSRAAQLVDEYVASAYSPERIYNPGRFDIYHANWRSEQTLPTEAYPTVVASVFDVIALKRPDWFVGPGEVNSIGEYLTGFLGSVRAQHVLTVNTESVKSDLVSMFDNIAADQVHVVPLGVSDAFSPCTDSEALDAVRAKYGIPAGHRYVLCLNTLEPRKNMVAAIEAYELMMREPGINDVSLVLAGSKGWLADDLVSRSERLAGPDSSVVVTGHVESDDLSALYSGASVFCYPSLDEGFGLPVLEAMRCEVPVVTSDRAPLLEVAGDAALHAPPDDPSALADALQRVLRDDGLARDLRERGLARASVYTWERSAAAMADVYEATRPSPVARPAGARAEGSTRPRRRRIPDSESLDDLRDAFRGERLFILGDCPDIVDGPIEHLDAEYTLAINSFHRHLPALKWKPSFYVVDREVLRSGEVGQINALTGSTLLVGDEAVEHLRTRPNVVPFTTTGPGALVDGVELFDGNVPPDLDGPDRTLAAAIQLAFHMGFEPIYLVSPFANRAWVDTAHPPSRVHAGEADPMQEWHLACRDAFAAADRQIRNLTPETLFDTYKRAEAHAVLAAPVLPDFGRDDHASLDETEVISTMLGTGAGRTMLDVGAHRGTSAQHFVDKGWEIYCFEPDPGNRSHLTKRFGDRENLRIDVRAVGETAGTNIPFFTSPQSTGISGLSAFHDSHELLGSVELTTVERILEQYDIDHVDFLKIDVEGFDFGVLKGVPWEDDSPDVIECEFEDAKTLPMGHSTPDVAEYLRARGYTVYLSEWHPIIRYGVAHEWRRVVPYPGFGVPTNSWGNLLAFKNDPGYAAVQAAFAAHVKTEKRSEPAPAAVVTPTVPAAESKPKAKAPSSARRAFYADFGDRLRRRSPKAYAALRLFRRATARLWRQRVLVLPAVVLLAGLVGLGFAASSDTWRYGIWAAVAVLVLGFAIVLLAMYAYQAARQQSATAARLQTLQKRLDADAKRDSGRLTRIERRVDDIVPSLERAGVAVDSLRTEFSTHIDRLAAVDRETAALHQAVEANRGFLDENVTTIRTDIATERSQRISGVARALSVGKTPEKLVLIVTTHRAGSTLFFDLVRSMDGVGVWPSAQWWDRLGLRGRRYPGDLSDAEDTSLEIESEPGFGTLIPDLQHRYAQTTIGVEKLHPEFFAYDERQFAAALAELRQELPVELVYLVRRPLDTMWSMAEYKQRNKGWYRHITTEQVPELIAQSLKTMAALREIEPGLVLDYRHLDPDGVELAARLAPVLGASREQLEPQLARAHHVLRREDRPGNGRGVFVGTKTHLRSERGPDGEWAELATTIEAADVAYARLQEYISPDPLSA